MKKAFTLIELLVVIAIIAILAAILFPVFAQAKNAAKKTQDLSNIKQIGTALQLYINDSDDVYPISYYLTNGVNETNGYTHWSGTLQPYAKNRELFVSPGDKLQGIAPNSWLSANNNQGKGPAAGQTSRANVLDVQVPRLSYVANALIMPGKPTAAIGTVAVGSGAIDDPSGTIIIAPMSDTLNCVRDAASGPALSYRPTNPLVEANGVAGFQGAGVAVDGISDISRTVYWAISVNAAQNALNQCRTSNAANLANIAYTSPLRFDNGANYVNSDTSARFRTLADTLNPDQFKWGKRAYGFGGQQINKPGTTVSVD